MLRARFVLLLLASAGCTRNPYVIGEHVPDECATERAGALACSGFEGDDFAEGWTETMRSGSANVERTTERAHTGRGALRATSSGSESLAVVTAALPAIDSGALYLRAHLFVPGDVPTETINIFFLGDQPAPDPFVGIDLNLEEAGALEIFSPQIAPARQAAPSAVPRDRWFCMRAEVQLGDGDGAIELFVDDESVLLVEDIDTLPPQGVRLFRAGIDWSSEQTEAFEMFFDDVVLDTEPVACRS